MRSLLIAHATVRTSLWLVPHESWLYEPTAAVVAVSAMRITLIVMTIASLWTRAARWAAAVAAAVVLAQVTIAFPDVGDHVYLELSCLALFALLDTEGDGPLLRSTLCWMAVIVVFWSGLQKLLYGYYFFAELPLLNVAARGSLAGLFQWTLPSAEVERLRQLNLQLPEAGPFRATTALPLVLSNAIWALELLLPLLMVARRTRTFAAGVAIVTVVIVYGAADEALYALLLGQLLLLCVPGEWNRRLGWIVAALYLLALLTILGVVPESASWSETGR